MFLLIGFVTHNGDKYNCFYNILNIWADFQHNDAYIYITEKQYEQQTILLKFRSMYKTAEVLYMFICVNKLLLIILYTSRSFFL